MSKSIYLGLLWVAFATFSCSTSDNPPPQEPEQEEEIELATAGTASSADVTDNSIVISATVSGESISDRGVVYGIDQNPTLSNNSVSSGSGAGSFSVTIENLQAETTYYARIYASNQAGTAYGPQLEFQTLEEIPQLIFDGDVVLETQAEVDAFGANNYTDITGSLTIDGIEEITDLTPLEPLMVVGGILEISSIEVTSLEGLHRLRFIGDRLRLLGLMDLENLQGLRGLRQIGNSINLSEVNGITNLMGLEQMEFIEEGTIGLFGNWNLVSTEGLNAPEICNSILINGNPSLTDLSGFSSVRQVTNTLQLFINDALVSSAGFEQLTSADFLNITSNENLQNLDGFSALNSTRVVQILTNASLTSLSGLSGLNNGIESFTLDSLPALVNLGGLQNLETIGTVGISNCNLITNIDELGGLTAVSGDLKLLGNEALGDFCAIRDLLINQGLSGALDILGNAYNPSEQDIIDGDCSL